MRTISFDASFDGWRDAARALLHDRIRPDDVTWDAGGAACAVDRDVAPNVLEAPDARVRRPFVALARVVACHRGDARWSALYRVAWRLAHGEPALLDVATDPDVHRLRTMERAVRRDLHKMHAFVRFRAVATDDGGTAYVAWFEPAHLIVAPASRFFARRFPSMRWSILTPDRCAHWDGHTVRLTPGATRADAAGPDALETLWRTYYAHVFNPARLALRAMRAEMPMRYWRDLPEASLVPSLARDAPRRVAEMLAQVQAPAAPLPREHAPHADPAFLARPNAWDPVHDPGTHAAHARDAAVPVDAPLGLTIDGVRVVHGVAGWTDPTLLAPGVFYPPDAATAEARLRHYASRYPMVEVDATYYAPPTRAMAAAWAARTPSGFTFDVKAFALMTGHAADVRRLPDWLRRALPRRATASPRVYGRDLPDAVADEMWRRFLAALDPLRESGRLGAVFLQFPRWFEPTAASARLLRRARERLGDVAAAVELRNPAWVEGRLAARTLALLRELDLAYTMVDAPPGTRSSMPPLVAVTSPTLIVVRFHGRRVATWEARNDPVSERYRYLYDAGELAAWVPRLRDAIATARLAGTRPRVHLAFNNNHANYGAVNARELAALLVAEGATPFVGAG